MEKLHDKTSQVCLRERKNLYYGTVPTDTDVCDRHERTRRMRDCACRKWRRWCARCDACRPSHGIFAMSRARTPRGVPTTRWGGSRRVPDCWPPLPSRSSWRSSVYDQRWCTPWNLARYVQANPKGNASWRCGANLNGTSRQPHGLRVVRSTCEWAMCSEVARDCKCIRRPFGAAVSCHGFSSSSPLVQWVTKRFQRDEVDSSPKLSRLRAVTDGLALNICIVNYYCWLLFVLLFTVIWWFF